MRICIVESSDFREAMNRFAEGASENYQAQVYSTDYIRSLTGRAERVTIACAKVPQAYQDTRYGLNIHGFEYWSPEGPTRLLAALNDADPTHIILRIPIIEVLDWAHTRNIPVAAMLADSFSTSGYSPRSLRKRLRYRRLAKALNRDNVTLVANHNRAACRDLVRIGVRKDKIIPWEWPTPTTPADFTAKSLKTGQADTRINLIYVGALLETKGLSDILEAMAATPFMKLRCHLTLIGAGDDALFKARADALGIAAQVTFAGVIPNADVFERLREADIALVPSHHCYPEGLPKTIREALTVRTPVIMSDHPMFCGYFSRDRGITMVPEKSPEALARAIEAMASDKSLYAEHSTATTDAFADIDWPHKWADIIDHWLNDDAKGFLAKHKGQWT